MVRLSIITVNYNNKAGLEKTLKSVSGQAFTDLEYIVIDGGSSDGSKDVIEANQQHLSYSVSEKDRGIYHAMNKGIQKASGQYLLFLNSGDYLHNPEVLGKVFKNELTEDIVYGDIIWDTDGIKAEHKFPDKVTFEYFVQDQILPHQGSFIKRSLFDTIGLYDENHKIISDWIFFVLAICRYNSSYKHISEVISVCGRDGISCMPENYAPIMSERKEELKKYFPAFIESYKELEEVKVELNKVKSMLGFRVHRKLNKFRGR